MAAPSLPPVHDSATASVCPRATRASSTTRGSETMSRAYTRSPRMSSSSAAAASSAASPPAGALICTSTPHGTSHHDQRRSGYRSRTGSHSRATGISAICATRHSREAGGAGSTPAATRRSRTSGSSPCNSSGTPGSTESQRPPSSPTRPGAEPTGLRTGARPRGTWACLKVAAQTAKPRWRARSASSTARPSSTSRGTPAQAAIASRVRSSAVEPRPP